MVEIKQDTDLAQELNEASVLTDKGIAFKITYKAINRKKGVRGVFQKKVIKTVTENFEIKQPTLNVLDRISAIAIEMIFDDSKLEGNALVLISNARELVVKNAKKMAQIVAIAVLGENYNVIEITNGRVVNHKNEKELKRLADLFYLTVNSQDLAVLANAVTTTGNLADFIKSIRLMSGARTTQPIVNRVE
jgi:uncharacterized protein YkvS